MSVLTPLKVLLISKSIPSVFFEILASSIWWEKELLVMHCALQPSLHHRWCSTECKERSQGCQPELLSSEQLGENGFEVQYYGNCIVIYAVIGCLRAKKSDDWLQSTGACLLAEVLEEVIESQRELVLLI